VTAQLGADQGLDRSAGEVFDLARGESNDASSVDEHQHTWNRCEQVGVNAENVRP
jgi:hypothetical protein